MAKDDLFQSDKSAFEVKVGLAEMLRGGVIIAVTTPEQAKIAENAGAAAVIALEKIPADIIEENGVSRMSHPELIQKIQEAVTIPVMAKCRIGHFVEAQILEALFVDFIDESEVLTPADEENYIDKHFFTIPFVCSCANLGEALRRIGEGAALIRTSGEAGSGNIMQAVKHMRCLNREIRELKGLENAELMAAARSLQAPYELVKYVAKYGKLPVPVFAGGGVATPADAALLMQLGAESIFVGSGIFKSEDPPKRAQAMVAAVSFYQDTEVLARISMGLLDDMKGINYHSGRKDELLPQRGW